MKKTPTDLMRMKRSQPIAVLTAYTFPVARAIERAGIDAILVGDTVGMVEMGFDSTRSVTIEHMEYHVGAVRRGAADTHVIGDLPYQTYGDRRTALANAERLMAAGADSVKLEGPMTEVIAHLVERGIPVVGHTGLTPQTAGSFRRVGDNEEDAERTVRESRQIQEAGAFMVVLEHMPSSLAERVSSLLEIPTIGIGAGPDCDGQVLVINDALGLGERWPPFSKQYAYLSHTVFEVAKEFTWEVETRAFPPGAAGPAKPR